MNSKFMIYIIKRFVLAVLTVFLVITITFFTMHAIPASPFSSEKAKSDKTIAALEAKYGFDKPVPVQFFNYLKNIVKLDFGLSTAWVGSTVFDLIKGGFSYSARIGLTAAVIAIVLGIVLGSIAALRRGRWLDKIIQVVTTALVSLPSFVIATLLLLTFALKFKLFPTLSTQPGGLVLPTVSLCLYPMAYITRLTRSSMLDVLGQDYIRTARAKGLKNSRVIFKHALEKRFEPRHYICRSHDGLYSDRQYGGREYFFGAGTRAALCQQHASHRLYDDYGRHNLPCLHHHLYEFPVGRAV